MLLASLHPAIAIFLIIISTAFIDWIRGDGPREVMARRREKKEKRIELDAARSELDRLAPEAEALVAKQSARLERDSEYLTKRDWDKGMEGAAEVVKALRSIPGEAVDAHPAASAFRTIERWSRRDLDRLKHNGRFKERELAECAAIFDDIEGRSLDDQQRDAVITDEYNNLIVAGAGSGKTLTVLGKVRYLVERLGVSPEEILVTSFTRKTVSDLRERLQRLGMGEVHCRTFHSIGLNQLPGAGVANENELAICAEEYLRKGIASSPEQVDAYLEFYGCYKHVPKDYEEYDTSGERFQELKATDLVTLKGKLDTLKGERVKSVEELMIANFLFLHGVSYEYERNYSGEYDTQGRAYQPDFYLTEYDIWLEHFGINEHGRLPWMENEIKEREYIEGMEWKRRIHAENGTTLIESYSYWNKDHDLLNKVESLLEGCGVVLRRDPELLAGVYDQLKKDDRYLSGIVKLATAFLSLAKANRIDMPEIWERGRSRYAGNGYLWRRFELFMTFVEPIMELYRARLAERNQVDFDDMINMAADAIRSKGMEGRYRYVIVDEYQDISRSRFELIQAIRSLRDAKLVCVGDDWQSIYRFAGSDVSLFTRFEDYVGYAARLKIETTYRNSQELVDIAAEFIERNPSQTHKVMRSRARHVKAPLRIWQMDDAARSFEDAVASILDERKGYAGEILVLGRHNRDIERIYPGLKGDKNVSFWREKGTGDLRIRCGGYDNIRYLTVHRAKGLEADDVIVLNLLNSLYGFPNRLEDDPVLQILLGRPEGFEFAEERRLFYVAMTRAKNTVSLISCSSAGAMAPSPFVDELKAGENASHILVAGGGYDEWDPVLCPACGTGRLVVRVNQETGEHFLGCTNYPFCNESYAQVEILEDRLRCPSCGDWMVRRRRRSDGAPFFGCSNYPRCNASYDADDDYKPLGAGSRSSRRPSSGSLCDYVEGRAVQYCPECGSELVVRQNGRDDKLFYGCSSYPDCEYTRSL